MSESTGRTRVAEDAARRGLRIEFAERADARSLAEAAEILGIEPSDIVKTLVVRLRTPKPEQYFFVLVSGDRQISWPKLRELIGANKLDLAQADRALEITGYGRGAITPLGSLTALPVIADET